MTDNDIDAIRRLDQQTAAHNALVDQMVTAMSANLKEGMEPGELAVTAAKTFLTDPDRACTIAGFALVRLAQVQSSLDANERSEDARLAIAEDELGKARTELAYALHELTGAETKVVELTDALAEARATANVRQGQLTQSREQAATYANEIGTLTAENARVRQQRDGLLADLTDAGNEVDLLTAENTRLRPVVEAAKTWRAQFGEWGPLDSADTPSGDLTDAVDALPKAEATR